MGRPSAEKKKEKRRRQKKQKRHSVKVPETDECNSPLLFSDKSSTADSDDPSRDDGVCHTHTALGDADTDIVEMELYDMYREDDAQPYSVEYLRKCLEKLRQSKLQDVT